jgi:hypothetical protein
MGVRGVEGSSGVGQEQKAGTYGIDSVQGLTRRVVTRLHDQVGEHASQRRGHVVIITPWHSHTVTFT